MKKKCMLFVLFLVAFSVFFSSNLMCPKKTEGIVPGYFQLLILCGDSSSRADRCWEYCLDHHYKGKINTDVSMTDVENCQMACIQCMAQYCRGLYD